MCCGLQEGIYDFRPQRRPFPRIFSCSGGHDCVDHLVNYPFDIEESIEQWEAQGGEGWQLIELVDGFHPR